MLARLESQYVASPEVLELRFCDVEPGNNQLHKVLP
jgi:hypothetical protein